MFFSSEYSFCRVLLHPKAPLCKGRLCPLRRGRADVIIDPYKRNVLLRRAISGICSVRRGLRICIHSCLCVRIRIGLAVDDDSLIRTLLRHGIAVVRDDEHLLQRSEVARRIERGIFRNARLIEARVRDVPEQQSARIERRTGRHDLILILDDRVGQQIVHSQDAGAVLQKRPLHDAVIARRRDRRADLQRRVHDRRHSRPVEADLRDQAHDLPVFGDRAHALFESIVRTLADGKRALIV